MIRFLGSKPKGGGWPPQGGAGTTLRPHGYPLDRGAAVCPNGAMPDGVITVVLADDNLLVRAGVRALLAREPDVEVVGEAADHPELLALAEEHQPQVVVTDIRMPP